MATEYRTNNHKMEITQLKIKVAQLEREIENINNILNGNKTSNETSLAAKSKLKKILRFSKPYSSFDTSFSIARNEGADIFIWNGNEYKVELYEDCNRRDNVKFTVEYKQ